MQSPAVGRRSRVGSIVLAALLLGGALVLGAWKHNRLVAERSATQPEPVEAVTVATAAPREHQETTTAIGTVLALESITLRNELPGTVRHVSLVPGSIVEAGTVLVALDTSVESADLRALQAQARLAETTLHRNEFLRQHEANAEAELDQARALREGIPLAEVERQSRASIPAGRYGDAAEFAALVAFLASARAAYMTGGVIRVDGGMIRSL